MTGFEIATVVSIATAGLAVTLGGWFPARAEGQALAQALEAIARQPDESDKITRTLFVGMAMIESTAIYALVIALILLFANPLLETIR